MVLPDICDFPQAGESLYPGDISTDYEEFMINCSQCKNGVFDYYNYYIGKYQNISIGKTENLCDDFIKILEKNQEEFNKEGIIKNKDNIIGKSNNNKTLLIDDMLKIKINQANADFCKKFGYDI